MKVKGYRLLVKDDPVEEVSEGGIALMFDKEKAKHAQMYGTVVDIGSECWKDSDEPWCKVGDRIAWSRFAQKFIEDDKGEVFVILNDEDVLLTL